MMEIKTFKAAVMVKNEEQGLIEAAFSVFNMIDTDNDVILPSFFTDGQEVPMSAWGHRWGELPPGKGTIGVQTDRAVFDAQMFLDTTHGLDTFRTIKHLAGLQQWSFGFTILDAEEGEFEGRPVRFLKKGEIHEVSPVFLGANRETQTLGVKSEGKGAMAPHNTPTDSEATWNGPAEVARMPNQASGLRAKHGWVDSDGEADAKSSYKFPHHPADRPHAIRAAVNNAKQEATALFMWLEYLEHNFDEEAVAEIKARLPQANIPEGDRAGVLRHLNGHFSSQASQDDPSDGKQSGWEEEADQQLDEALRREAQRAGVEIT